MARSLDFIINSKTGQLLSSFDSSTNQPTIPSFIFGDTVPITVRIVEPTAPNSEKPWQDVDLTDQTVRIALGLPGQTPTSGTFTITYDGDTTSALAYNATSAQVQTALNALASITSEGGVTVASGNTGTYQISFVVAGVTTDFTIDTVGLFPSSSAYSASSNKDEALEKSLYILRLEVNPAAYAELTDELPVAATTITEIRVGGVGIGAIQSFSFNPIPYAGTYLIDIDGEETTALQALSNAATIQAALEALPAIGAGMVTVEGEFPNFTANFDATLEDVELLTIDVTNLTVPTGRSGNLSINTTGVASLLSGRTRVDVTLEFEILDDITSDIWTVSQNLAILREDVIPNNPSSDSTLPLFLLETVGDARYVALTGNQTVAGNKTFTGRTVLGANAETLVAIGNSGSSKTLVVSVGTFQTVTLTDNCTFTMPTATAGERFTLKVLTGAGAFSPTFTGVKYADNTTPTWNTTASRYYFVEFIADGTAWSAELSSTYHV